MYLAKISLNENWKSMKVSEGKRRTKSRVSLKVVDPNKSWLVGDSFQLVPAAKEITTHVCEKIRERHKNERARRGERDSERFHIPQKHHSVIWSFL